MSHDGSALPLGPDVRRAENALTNANGEHEVRESFVRTPMIEAVRDPRFVVDANTRDVVVLFGFDVGINDTDAKDTTSKVGDSEYKVAVTVTLSQDFEPFGNRDSMLPGPWGPWRCHEEEPVYRGSDCLCVEAGRARDIG